MRSPAPGLATGMAIGLMTLTGCYAHSHYPYHEQPMPEVDTPDTIPADHTLPPANVTLTDSGTNRYGYTMEWFSMPASFENGQPGNSITGTYYASGTSGIKPLVIVLPVWGVSDYPSARITETILKRSRGAMNVLLVDGKRRLIPWREIAESRTKGTFIDLLDNAASRLEHAVLDLRRVLDWAASRSELDGDRVGLTGFSIGAVVGSLVAQKDSRVRSAALVMGGADIPGIMAQCPRSKGRTRRTVRQNLGLSLRRYEQTISAAFRGLDPLDYPNRVDPAGILIVDAANDECIPERSRDALWEVLGRPERITMHYGHRGSFLAMTPLGLNFLRRRIYEHLEATLRSAGEISGRSTPPSAPFGVHAGHSPYTRWAR